MLYVYPTRTTESRRIQSMYSVRQLSGGRQLAGCHCVSLAVTGCCGLSLDSLISHRLDRLDNGSDRRAESRATPPLSSLMSGPRDNLPETDTTYIPHPCRRKLSLLVLLSVCDWSGGSHCWADCRHPGQSGHHLLPPGTSGLQVPPSQAPAGECR